MKKLLINALVFLAMGTTLLAQDLCPISNWEQGLGKVGTAWGHLYVSNIVVVTSGATNEIANAVSGASSTDPYLIQYGTATNGEVVVFSPAFEISTTPSVQITWTDTIPILSNAVLCATGIASNTFTVINSDGVKLAYTNVNWTAVGIKAK